MTDALERAAARLNASQARMPDVVRLARVCSLAVRLEPHLLRQLRVELLPDVDVGTEADLWFSPLVESRGASAVVLQQHVASLLREDLARDPDLLARVDLATARGHVHLAPVLRLEQAVTTLALRGSDAAVARIDEVFRPVLRALKEGDERAMEVARWMLRAAPRFPPAVWRASSAYSLLHAASVLLGGRRVLEDVPNAAGADIDVLAWALPDAVRTQRARVGIELGPTAVAFSEPAEASAAIEVPPTTPPVVEVRWSRAGAPVRALVEAVPGRYVELEPGVEQVTIRTAAGDVYTVQRATPQAPEFTHDVFISYARADVQAARRLAEFLSGHGLRVWVDSEQLVAGEEWAEATRRAIAGARLIVALWSRAAASSEFVRSEIEDAMKRDALVPVLIDETPLPPILSHLHAIDLRWQDDRAREQEAAQRVLQAILKRLGDPPRAWTPRNARVLAPTWMENACVTIRDASGTSATAFYIGPRLLATAAEPFRSSGLPRLEIRRGEFAEDLRIINPADAGHVLLLEPVSGLAFSEPLPLATTVTSRPSTNVLAVPSTARVVMMVDGQALSLEANAHALHDQAARFEIELAEPELPRSVLGSPVIVGDGVAGIVTEVRTSRARSSTVHVTGAIVLRKMVERARFRGSEVAQSAPPDAHASGDLSERRLSSVSPAPQEVTAPPSRDAAGFRSIRVSGQESMGPPPQQVVSDQGEAETEQRPGFGRRLLDGLLGRGGARRPDSSPRAPRPKTPRRKNPEKKK